MFTFLADVLSTVAPVSTIRSLRSHRRRSCLPPLGISALLVFSLAACSDRAADPVVVGGSPTSQLKGTVQIEPASFILSEGESIDLSATFGSTHLGPNQLTWSVEPSNVATIDIYGKLTALKHGEATVTARYSSVRGASLATIWAIPSAVEPSEALSLAGIVGRATPDSIGVRAVNPDGVPVPGVDVDFQVLVGDGVISHSTQTTGLDGVARVEWKLGTTAGPQQLHAGAEGLGSMIFQADAIPDYDSATVSIVAGDDQEGIVTDILPEDLQAQVTDQFGNVLPGLAVNWSFSDGGAALGFPGSSVMAVTDLNGNTGVTWRLGTVAGDQEASCAPPGASAYGSSGANGASGASSQGGSGPEAGSDKNNKGGRGKNWKAKARPSDPAGVLVNPTDARTVVGVEKDLKAAVVDSHGNPIPGFSFSWDMDNSGAVDWVNTGDLDATVVGVKSGTTMISASAVGMNLTGTGTVTVESRMPSGLARRAGNWQTGRVGETLVAPISVLVTDQVGFPVPGIEVSWEVVPSASTPESQPGQPAAGSTVTNENGVAQTQWSLGTAAGVQTINARVGSLDPVEFKANATPAAAAEVSVTPSTAEIEIGESVQLQAVAYDGFGNEIQAAQVTWATLNPNVAVHEGSGTFRGTQAGMATATATVGEASGQAELTVTYQPLPDLTVTSVSPAEGPVAGGTHVTVYGSGFEDGATVSFGGTSAFVVIFNSETSLRVTTPPGSGGPANVTVWNPGDEEGVTLEGGFTYQAPPPPSQAPAPSVGTATPSSGPASGGTQVVIVGSSFESGASVTFDGEPATQVVFFSETSIMATAPGGEPGPADVVVRNPDQQADTLQEAFTYLGDGPPAPEQITVTAADPADGFMSGGTPVTITGTAFVPGAEVTFGGVSAGTISFNSETSISVLSPPGAEGPVDIVVEAEGYLAGTLSNGFTYVPDIGQTPQFSVDGINPNAGPETGGTPVTITGVAFEAGTTVAFGGTLATNIQVQSSTSLTATPPAGFPGTVDVVVTLPSGAYETAPGGFTYTPVLDASNSIDLALLRTDGGSGNVLVTNGIPLQPGALMPGDLDQVRVTVGGVEQSIYIEALRGRHRDGSLRSVLVQFEQNLESNTAIGGAFEWGPEVSRSLPARSKSQPQAIPNAVALPVDPDYLVRTGIALHPVMTEAEIKSRFAGTMFDDAVDIFRQYSDEHWNYYGADYNTTTMLYDRALNHWMFWAMTGEPVYWYRAAANAIEARSGSTTTPQTSGVAPRFYQPDGMALHYFLTGDETSIDYLIGGLTRMSLMAGHNPTNLSRFGVPPAGYEYNEGRIRARILLGTLWADILGDTSADWGSRADQIVQGMIDGQNANGSFTYRLGTDATSPANLRFGQSNFMEGLAMDALIKYYNLRDSNPQVVDLVQGMVDFLSIDDWDHSYQTWHYWSPRSAWDIGDEHVPLKHIDGLNSMLTIGHYWTDHVRGTTTNRTRADAAWAQCFGPSGAQFDTLWGKKNFNQVFLNAFPQLFYRGN